MTRPNEHPDDEPGRGRKRQRELPGNPASAIYGSIITASVLAAQADHPAPIGRLVLLLLGTSFVFWIAHAYTDVLGLHIKGAVGDYTHALREQWPIVESCGLPVVVLAVVYAVGAELDTAITVALVLDVVELIGWAGLAARRMELTWFKGIAFTLVNGMLGLAIVGLKVLLH